MGRMTEEEYFKLTGKRLPPKKPLPWETKNRPNKMNNQKTDDGYDSKLEQGRAKQLQMEHMAEEMIDIADDGSNDLMTIVKGDESYEQENKEIVNRAKIRIDTRKWLMSKLNPKKYGDKLDLTSDNKALAPTNITIVRDGGD